MKRISAGSGNGATKGDERRLSDKRVEHRSIRLLPVAFLVFLSFFFPASATAAAPGNDNFVDAKTLTGLPASTTGTSVDATRENGEPDHGDFGGGSSVWYKWTAPGSAWVTVDLSGSGFDTYLAVYSGSSLNSLSPVAEDDDGGDGLTSKLSFLAESGETYQIAVDGYEGDTGSVVVRISSAGSISGTVSDSSTEPLEDICVTAFDASGDEAASALSDFNGNYTIGGLLGGNYRLRFTNCGLNNVAGEYYDNQPDLGSANPVAVILGSETSGIDAELADGGSITGTVTDPSAVPLENICVDTFDADGNPSGSGSTESDGSFAVDDLAGGDHRVRFYDCGSNNVLSEYFSDKPDLASADPVTVTPGSDTPDINAVLARGGSISGMVTNTSALPLENICVDVFDANDDPTASSYTDSGGAYTVTGLPGGSYRVLFFDCGRGVFTDEYYDNQPDLDSAEPVAVSAGSNTPGINAALFSSDNTAPDTVIDAGPDFTISTSQATFEFRGDPIADTAKIQCRIDSEPFAECTSPKTFTGLSDGLHTAEFRAEDAAGNQDPTPASRTFMVDAAVDPPVGNAKIAKVKVKGPAKVRKGKKATYKVKISNSGSIEAKGVRLKVSGRGVSFNTSVGKVAASKTRTVKVKLKPKKRGKVKVSFRVKSSNAGGKTVKKRIRVRR